MSARGKVVRTLLRFPQPAFHARRHDRSGYGNAHHQATTDHTYIARPPNDSNQTRIQRTTRMLHWHETEDLVRMIPFSTMCLSEKG